MSYSVKLEIFEGPLDLLLHLIKKNEVEITDLPIATITDQYLSYLELLQEMDLDVAGEFLVMAATLLYLKSRTLLPLDEEDAEEEEEPDPEGRLVQQLLEYARYREAAMALGERTLLFRDVFPRGGPAEFDGHGEPAVLRALGPADLLDVLLEVVARCRQVEAHEVGTESFTVADAMGALCERLGRERWVRFFDLFSPWATRAVIVVTFLALLELLRIAAVRVVQRELFGDIYILPGTGDAATRLVGAAPPHTSGAGGGNGSGGGNGRG